MPTVLNAFCVCLDVSRVRHKTTKKVYDHGHTVETGLQMQRTIDGPRRDGAGAAGGPEAQTETFL